MTVETFFGCTLLAFGCPLALFIFTISRDPVRCVHREQYSGSLGSVFFWASRIQIWIRKLFVRIRIWIQIRFLPSVNKKKRRNHDFLLFCDLSMTCYLCRLKLMYLQVRSFCNKAWKFDQHVPYFCIFLTILQFDLETWCSSPERKKFKKDFCIPEYGTATEPWMNLDPLKAAPWHFVFLFKNWAS